jgi:hypothetical protein
VAHFEGNNHTKIRSPNFSIFIQAWKGSCNSLPLMTIFGKSSKWTSKGSSDTSTDLTLGAENNPRTQHALSSDNDLLRLFFDRQGTDQCCNLFGCLPLCELAEPLLTSPYARVNDLEEQLPRPRIEDKNSTVCDASRQILASYGLT